MAGSKPKTAPPTLRVKGRGPPGNFVFFFFLFVGFLLARARPPPPPAAGGGGPGPPPPPAGQGRAANRNQPPQLGERKGADRREFFFCFSFAYVSFFFSFSLLFFSFFLFSFPRSEESKLVQVAASFFSSMEFGRLSPTEITGELSFSFPPDSSPFGFILY